MSSSTDNFSATMRDGLSNLARRLRFAMKEGSIWLGEQRMILLHTAALGALRKELVDTLGMERARGLFMRMGFHSGLRDAELAKTMRSGHSDFGMLEMGPCLHTIEGVVRVTPLTVDINIAAGVYHGEFLWEDSFEGDVHRQMFGVAQAPVCWMQIGYATGYTSALMGKTILYRELECVGCGQPHCRILGKPLEQWEDGEAELALYQPDPVIDTILALQSEVEQLRALQRANDQPADLVGGSPGFRAAWNLLQRAAGSSVTVLLLGETGVGKERFAQALHGVSARADKPFVAVNCAAIPDELIESELFGVEKGAFTGAHQSRAGRFERAHGGTLFLDELGELSASAQSKLLRVLQEGEVERVGGNEARKVDVRLVAATNADLAAEVARGAFRKDLLFRLNTVELHLPPLRERGQDIRRLAQAFATRFARRYQRSTPLFSDDALRALDTYPWPGNVRELSHAVERAILMLDGERIDADALNLRPPAGHPGGAAAAAPSGESMSVDAAEERLVREALDRTGGNVQRAAGLLGLSRPALYRRMEKYGIG